MSEFSVRFFGRFVFFDNIMDKKTSALDVGAVDMRINPDVAAHVHAFRLTARRSDVVTAGTRPPTGVVISAEKPIASEYVYWDLAGHDVEISPTNSASSEFTWGVSETTKGPIVLPDLWALGNGSGVLKREQVNMRATTGSVRISCGTAVLGQMMNDEMSEFVRIADPSTPIGCPERLADYVSVALEGDLLTLYVRPRAGGSTSAIVIRSVAASHPVVTFSNLCAQAHPEVDAEFAGLYEVLPDPPMVRHRKVPKRVTGLYGSFDCYKKARVGVVVS